VFSCPQVVFLLEWPSSKFLGQGGDKWSASQRASVMGWGHRYC